jgi:hypothetical protein
MLPVAVILLTAGCASVGVRGVVRDEARASILHAIVTLRPVGVASEPIRASTENHGCFWLYEHAGHVQHGYELHVEAAGFKPLTLPIETSGHPILLVTLVRTDEPGQSEARPIDVDERERIYSAACEPLARGNPPMLH